VISVNDIRRAWNRFFFEPISPLPIAVYRILLGVCILANQLLLAPDAMTWWGERGSLTFQTALTVPGGAGVSLFKILPHSNAIVWLVFIASCLAAISLALGFYTRTSAVLTYLLFVTLDHRNPVILNSGDTFLRIATFFLIFSPAGKVLSVDEWLQRKRGVVSAQLYAPWAMRLIQLQLAFLYFYAFIWKISGTMWMGGTAVYYTSRLLEFWRFPVPYVFEHMWTIKLWSWFTLVVEFALGTLIWIKEFRYAVLISGILLHLGIDYSMNIPLFAFVMISAYVTFVEPADLERWLGFLTNRFKRKAPLASPAPVRS
jgi:uncharacterized membrane protein YphA (DoxX/SURF4 family)